MLHSLSFFSYYYCYYEFFQTSRAFSHIDDLLQVVNRIQKLRKKAGLEPTDLVEVFFESLDADKSVSKQILESQVTSLLVSFPVSTVD